MNKLILIGRISTDPELRYTPSGVAVCSFSIAVDRDYKPANGEKETDFIEVVAWKQSAEFVANYLEKGRLIAVDGRLQIRKWKAEDGSNRKTAECIANNIKGLDKPKNGAQPESNGDARVAGQPPAQEVPAAVGDWDTTAPEQEFHDPFADI